MTIKHVAAFAALAALTACSSGQNSVTTSTQSAGEVQAGSGSAHSSAGESKSSHKSSKKPETKPKVAVPKSVKKANFKTKELAAVGTRGDKTNVTKVTKKSTSWGEQWTISLTSLKGVRFEGGYVKSPNTASDEPVKELQGTSIFEVNMWGIDTPDVEDAKRVSSAPVPKSSKLVKSTLFNPAWDGMAILDLGCKKKYKFTMHKSKTEANTVVINLVSSQAQKSLLDTH